MSTAPPERSSGAAAAALLAAIVLVAVGIPQVLGLRMTAGTTVAIGVLVASAFGFLAARIGRLHAPDSAAPAAGTGTEDALLARVEAQRVELETLARRIMTVQEDERAALSRELHDDIGQAITAIKLCASSLLHEPVPHAVVQDTATEIATIADQTVAKLRDLSLLLRPPQLDALGLDAALRWQAQALFRTDSPALVLDIPPLDCRPPRDVELACFRIAQEAMTNVLRHADARRISLQLDCDDAEIRLRVEDDGGGIAVDHRAGLGLITMRERARQLGGTLALDSRPGRTRVEATLPLPARSDPRSAPTQD